jgi:intein/homing endonuclease
VRVWTKKGLISIKDVKIGDYVYTHKGRWRKVLKTFSREINENLIKVTTELGEFSGTKEHPIRILQGKNEAASTLNYRWIPMKNIEIGDLISCHKITGYCEYCGAPRFRRLNRGRSFCSNECRFNASGNRLGSHYVSKLRGITKKENPNLSGGVKTKEGFDKQRIAHQTLEFRQKRKEIQTELWRNPEYAVRQCILQRRRPNKTELFIENLFNTWFYNEWKYVGNGKFWIEGKNPDYINTKGKKKVIEYNGIFWHKEDDSLKRIEHFRKYGYEVLILDDDDLKDLNYLKKKVEEFTYNALNRVIKIEEIEYKGLVYNLEVEEDNSYTTEYAMAHNCETGVNPESKFDVLWNPQKIEV